MNTLAIIILANVLSTALSIALAALLSFRYPLAEIADGADGRPSLRDGEGLDRLLGKIP